MFELCTKENPCGNHGVWMRGDRIALTFRPDWAGPAWTGKGTILNAAIPIPHVYWSDDEARLVVLFDGEERSRIVHPFNLALLPR